MPSGSSPASQRGPSGDGALLAPLGRGEVPESQLDARPLGSTLTRVPQQLPGDRDPVWELFKSWKVALLLAWTPCPCCSLLEYWNPQLHSCLWSSPQQRLEIPCYQCLESFIVGKSFSSRISVSMHQTLLAPLPHYETECNAQAR